MNIWNKYQATSLVIKMSAGFLLGIVVALIFREQAGALRPLGTIFIRLLSLIATPVIFLTVVLAIGRMNIRQMGRLGAKLILYYAVTTAMAVCIGVSLALLFNPGLRLSLPNTLVEKPHLPHATDMLLDIVPDNVFAAFASGNLMAILFIAIIMGMAMSAMSYATDKNLQDHGLFLERLFSAFNELFYKILAGILLYAPIGVFAISAATFGAQSWLTLKSLLVFTGTFYLGLIFLWLLVYTSFVKLAGFGVIRFFTDIKEAYATAFFTTSSLASLPVAIQSAKKAGISEKTANFALPLGAIFNSDGGALRMGVSLVFAANIVGLDLAWFDFIAIVVIGTLLSIGTAGVPAAGLVTLSAVLSLFGLPLEIVALIAGVDAILNMGGTASNVAGDIIGAAVIDEKPVS
ncbi:dicarboxylate/amino acid:cation symporter [Oceanisphaera avium]|uniref:Dicarboxylate/amino acid:cation symporter n=1 Tax=Oceanisphaera avium TaxID=1903694 RepID=A0A1Y0D119_9GAMM|nr:dicarboxylate/amino acid:cation symporter [Oceanisphaera avium]ART80795.1 dicarboxylate/amino acid:cation symporter [Oceanisphaera avium]